MNPVLFVANNELSRIIKHPLVITTSIILFLLSIINGRGSVHLISPVLSEYLQAGKDPFLFIGFGNTYYHTALLMLVLSFSIGLLFIAEDRAKGTIRVLLSKPLYRRDIIAGKFLGLSMFISILSAIMVLLNVSTIMFFYGGPLSMDELAIRVISNIILLSLSCIETLGIAMFIGLLFKNIYRLLIVAGTLLCFEWLYNIPVFIYKIIGDLIIIFPHHLYLKATWPGGQTNYLFDTTVPYFDWLSAALPYIVLSLVAILAIFFITCYVFNKEES